MGFDPSSAATLLDNCGDDQVAIVDLLEDISERAERTKLADMLRMASAVRAGGASGKDGYSAYMGWRREITDAMKPKPKKTVFDRLGRAEQVKPATIWDKMGG